MKNLLLIAGLALLFTACKKEETVVEPVKEFNLENTVWTKFDNEDNGKMVFKVFEFSKHTVSTGYKINKTEKYIELKPMEYVYSPEKKEVWISHSEFPTIKGVFISDTELYIGGEILNKEP